MKIVTKADAGQWLKATTEYERIMSKAATLAMREVGRDAVAKGRASMAAGGFSTRFQRTLRAINKPPSGYVLNPSVYVHSRINWVDIFETGGTIQAKSGDWLWLPLPSVPAGNRREHMTPSQYVKNIGPLIKLRRPAGSTPILAAVIRRGSRAQPFGRFATRGQLRRGLRRRGETFQPFDARGGAGTEIIPLFVGVRSVTIPKKFDVHGAAEEAFAELDKLYKENLEPYEGRR
jgi:Family of unknown function (DUF6441)